MCLLLLHNAHVIPKMLLSKYVSVNLFESVCRKVVFEMHILFDPYIVIWYM